MRAFTVVMEHGPWGERELVTLEIEASDFSTAVHKAKAGLVEPRSMRVTCHGVSETPEPSLFENQT